MSKLKFSTRTTDKDLQAIVDRINLTMGTPMVPYVKHEDGTWRAQIGNYHLDCAYGGVSLCRMCNEGGGITNVLGIGYVPKRELQSLMFAFIRGIELVQEQGS